MNSYACDVAWKATVIERTIVRANNKEEAIKKIKDGDVDDVIDNFIETEEFINADFFQEDEIDD